MSAEMVRGIDHCLFSESDDPPTMKAQVPCRELMHFQESLSLDVNSPMGSSSAVSAAAILNNEQFPTSIVNYGIGISSTLQQWQHPVAPSNYFLFNGEPLMWTSIGYDRSMTLNAESVVSNPDMRSHVHTPTVLSQYDPAGNMALENESLAIQSRAPQETGSPLDFDVGVSFGPVAAPPTFDHSGARSAPILFFTPYYHSSPQPTSTPSLYSSSSECQFGSYYQSPLSAFSVSPTNVKREDSRNGTSNLLAQSRTLANPVSPAPTNAVSSPKNVAPQNATVLAPRALKQSMQKKK